MPFVNIIYIIYISKNMKRKHLDIFIVLFFFVTCILFIKLFIDFSERMNTKYEGFTPNIRGIFRPNIRKTRIFVESFANKHYNNGIYYFTKMLRKANLY